MTRPVLSRLFIAGVLALTALCGLAPRASAQVSGLYWQCVAGDPTKLCPVSSTYPLPSALSAGSALIGTVGGTDARASAIPAVQNAAYASGNDIGGLVSFTLPRTASGIVNTISIKFVGGATTAITAYCFDSNPSSSTFTDKGTFTLATADLDKQIFIPQILSPTVQGTGSAVTFATSANLGRMFNSTPTLWCAFVSGGTFTPASTTDMHVEIQYDLNIN